MAFLVRRKSNIAFNRQTIYIRLLTMCWIAAFGTILGACKARVAPPPRGQLTLDYIGASPSDVTFTLGNGTSQPVFIRGSHTLSFAIQTWGGDTGFECEASSRQVPEEEPLGFGEGKRAAIKISSGEQVRLIVATTLPQRYKGGHCRLRLRLYDGTLLGPKEFQP